MPVSFSTFSIGHVAWQGRYCALSYNSLSLFMKHVYSQVAHLPCDVHDCELCTTESRHDFTYVDDRIVSVMTGNKPIKAFHQNFFPSFESSEEKTKKDIRKRVRTRHRGASSSSALSPRLLALQHHAHSTTPQIDNPYEEEVIREIKALRRTGTTNNKQSRSMFPYIPGSPPPRTSGRLRLNTDTTGNRRTISAPGVKTNSLRTLVSKN